MGHLVHLSAGGLEQDGCAHTAVDVAESSLGIHVQGFGMGHRSGKVGFDGHVEPSLAQLAEDHGTELRHVQGRRSQRDQRLRSRLMELLACGLAIHCASKASAPRVC